MINLERTVDLDSLKRLKVSYSGQYSLLTLKTIAQVPRNVVTSMAVSLATKVRAIEKMPVQRLAIIRNFWKLVILERMTLIHDLHARSSQSRVTLCRHPPIQPSLLTPYAKPRLGMDQTLECHWRRPQD